MDTIVIFIKTDSITISENINPNSQISFIFDIIKIKIGEDIRKSHTLIFGTHILDESQTLQYYKILNGSTIRTNFSIGKINYYKPVDTIGMLSYQNLINELGKTNVNNDFTIISLLSFNMEKTNLEKNLSQQLQPKTIKFILETYIGQKPNTNININIVLVDIGFIDYNNYYLNHDFKKCKNTPQINDILSLEPCKNFTSLDNRILKFKTNDTNIIPIYKYLNISNNTNIKLQFTFYFVGVDIKNMDSDGNICSVDYTPIINDNLFVNMWTQQNMNFKY